MFEGTARIDGRLEGDISTEGTLLVGNDAVIEGNIVAGIVICGGSISGDIIASEKVELKAPAVLIGRVKAPRLSLEEGVSFMGSSEVQNTVNGVSEEESDTALLSEPAVAGMARVAEPKLARKKLIPWSTPPQQDSSPAAEQVAI
jgi:cytoskeletal protein CcmA (bactofilin family)